MSSLGACSTFSDFLASEGLEDFDERLTLREISAKCGLPANPLGCSCRRQACRSRCHMHLFDKDLGFFPSPGGLCSKRAALLGSLNRAMVSP